MDNKSKILEDVTLKINKFILKELDKTNGVDEALAVAGSISAAMFKLYVMLLGEDSARKVFLAMSNTSWPPPGKSLPVWTDVDDDDTNQSNNNSPTMH